MSTKLVPQLLSEDEVLRNRVLTCPGEGWIDLLSRYASLIQGRIASYRFSPDDAEDVYQEVCLRLVKNEAKLLRDWDPTRGPLPLYLGLITTSVCLNYLKSGFYAYRQRKLEPKKGTWSQWEIFALLEDPAPTPAERLQRLERLRQVETYLEAWADSRVLSQRDRLFIRFRLGGMSYEELSAILGISLSYSKVLFFRLRKDLIQFFIQQLR